MRVLVTLNQEFGGLAGVEPASEITTQYFYIMHLNGLASTH